MIYLIYQNHFVEKKSAIPPRTFMKECHIIDFCTCENFVEGLQRLPSRPISFCWIGSLLKAKAYKQTFSRDKSAYFAVFINGFFGKYPPLPLKISYTVFRISSDVYNERNPVLFMNGLTEIIPHHNKWTEKNVKGTKDLYFLSDHA